MATWDIGAPVAAFTWKSASPRAQLLLMHGLGEYSERYLTFHSELIPKLNQQGIDVYAFDLPGHGRTAGERGLVDVNQGVALHLQARSRLPVGLPTVLYGHSLGGLITAASIVRERGNISAAVISSAAMQTPSKRWERILASVSTRLAPGAPMPLPRPGIEALSRDKAFLAEVQKDELFYEGKAKNLVAKTVLEVSDQVWAATDNWKAPTLIIHGNKDTSTSHLNSMGLHQAIASPDKELKIYPGGHHELLNDLCKSEVEEDLFEWLLARV